MEYLIITIVLFVAMLVYFKVANKYNIIDKPNHRSAHTQITLRGGGIIFPIAFLLFVIKYVWGDFFHFPVHHLAEENQNFLMFGSGLLLICAISFVDDIYDISSKIRIIFHFLAVTLLLLFLEVFTHIPIWIIPVFYVLIIGILNAYNFMDGINGITGSYSLIILGSLLYVNQNIVEFTDQDFIIYPILACLVFLFFNFRKKAKCFMGDIGSMGIAFWVIGLIGLLIMKTGEFKWILFLTVYGVEVITTILERIKLKENIFEAHRRHLYQLLANEKKVSHLVISVFYALIQGIINAIVIHAGWKDNVIFAVILLPVFLLYILAKISLIKQLKRQHLL